MSAVCVALSHVQICAVTTTVKAWNSSCKDTFPSQSPREPAGAEPLAPSPLPQHQLPSCDATLQGVTPVSLGEWL